MASLANWIRTRIIPAVLIALGVTFLAVGLMQFTTPVQADPLATPSPSPEAVVQETFSPRITLPPIGSGGPPPSAAPCIPADRVATRVRVAALKIDLPIVATPNGYPLCNVAMYYNDERLGQPGEGRATYLFAHARTGMFLPLLTASKVSNGKKMHGMLIEIWTSDDQRFLYVITQVRRHVPVTEGFLKPFAATQEEIWLQTSEGVGPMPKLQVVGELLSQEASPHADAHPKAKPLNCA